MAAFAPTPRASVEYGDGGEARGPGQRPKAVAKVLEEGGHLSRSSGDEVFCYWTGGGEESGVVRALRRGAAFRFQFTIAWMRTFQQTAKCRRTASVAPMTSGFSSMR